MLLKFFINYYYELSNHRKQGFIPKANFTLESKYEEKERLILQKCVAGSLWMD